jgi:hypothetical protein
MVFTVPKEVPVTVSLRNEGTPTVDCSSVDNNQINNDHFFAYRTVQTIIKSTIDQNERNHQQQQTTMSGEEELPANGKEPDEEVSDNEEEPEEEDVTTETAVADAVPNFGPLGRVMIAERSLTAEARLNYGNPSYVPDNRTLMVSEKPYNLTQKGGLGLVKHPHNFQTIQLACNNDGHAPWNKANNTYGLQVLSLMLAMYDPTKKNNKLSPSDVCVTVLTEESKHLADLYNAEYTEPSSRTKNQLYKVSVGFSKPFWNCNRKIMTIAAYFMQIRTGTTPEPASELAAMVSAIKKHFVNNGASEDHKEGQLKNQKSWVLPIILLVNDHLAGYETCRRLKIEPIPFNPDSTMDISCSQTRDAHDKSIYVNRELRILEKRASTNIKYKKYLEEYYKFEGCPVNSEDNEEVFNYAENSGEKEQTDAERKRRRLSIF